MPASSYLLITCYGSQSVVFEPFQTWEPGSSKRRMDLTLEEAEAALGFVQGEDVARGVGVEAEPTRIVAIAGREVVDGDGGVLVVSHQGLGLVGVGAAQEVRYRERQNGCGDNVTRKGQEHRQSCCEHQDKRGEDEKQDD